MHLQLQRLLSKVVHAQVESWHPCPHIPGCIVVNVGDSLQAWSDGVLKSNFHRVRMPTPGEPTVRPDCPAPDNPPAICCRPVQACKAVAIGSCVCFSMQLQPVLQMSVCKDQDLSILEM